jgi:hypothetical protein
MLLFWSKDVAQGRRLAAVKFDSLVKIDTIRVVPAGTVPFAVVPEETGFVIFPSYNDFGTDAHSRAPQGRPPLLASR